MKQRAIIPVLTPIAEQEIPPVKGDTKKLLAELQAFLPVERLVTKPDDLFAYECDAQTFDRAVPLGVAFPETTAEVSRIVQLCCTHNVPFVPRGAGTGLSGGVVAVGSL
jgi:glycolate oxidase